jgi:molecular chaperone DnaJ
MNLRLSGQGAEGDPGAPRGNLLVQVIVDEDKDGYFNRDGVDIHTEAPISLTQAVLGGSVDVRTLTGVVEMKIPKGCQIDSRLLLRGKGIQRLQSTSKGNHIVHLKMEIPKKITPRQEELLREFDEEMKDCGGGVSGRLAKAAGSAFESFFGSKKKDKKKKDKSSKDKDSDDEPDEKK